MGKQPDVASRIRTELATYLKRDVESVLPRYSLSDDLGLDSMATIELLYRIEEAFDLQIPDDDLPKLLTVADVIGNVEGKLAPRATTVAAKGPAKPPRTQKKR